MHCYVKSAYQCHSRIPFRLSYGINCLREDIRMWCAFKLDDDRTTKSKILIRTTKGYRLRDNLNVHGTRKLQETRKHLKNIVKTRQRTQNATATQDGLLRLDHFRHSVLVLVLVLVPLYVFPLLFPFPIGPLPSRGGFLFGIFYKSGVHKANQRLVGLEPLRIVHS